MSLSLDSHLVESQDVSGIDFDTLYQSQWWPMLRLAQGLVDSVAAAEDVVQDAFTALYRNQENLRDINTAVGYLRVSVVNAARSALRRRQTVRAHQHLLPDPVAPPADHHAMQQVEWQRIRTALAKLPHRQREVVCLRYLVGLSDPEIGQATGLSDGGVRSAASRGRAALRASLGGRKCRK